MVGVRKQTRARLAGLLVWLVNKLIATEMVMDFSKRYWHEPSDRSNPFVNHEMCLVNDCRPFVPPHTHTHTQK